MTKFVDTLAIVGALCAMLGAVSVIHIGPWALAPLFIGLGFLVVAIAASWSQL